MFASTVPGFWPGRITDHVEPAIATVVRGRTNSAVRSIVPRRGLRDLVLPDAQMAQIEEIASAAPSVAANSRVVGFSRHAGYGGIKVLFTGEPGAG